MVTLCSSAQMKALMRVSSYNVSDSLQTQTCLPLVHCATVAARLRQALPCPGPSLLSGALNHFHCFDGSLMWRRADYQGCRDHTPQMTPSATNHQAGRDKGVRAEGCDNSSALNRDAVPSSLWTFRRWWPAASPTPAAFKICFHTHTPKSHQLQAVFVSFSQAGFLQGCATTAVTFKEPKHSRSSPSSMWCFLMQMKTCSWLEERVLRLWGEENCNYGTVRSDPPAEVRATNYMWMWNLLQKEVISGTRWSDKIRFRDF